MIDSSYLRGKCRNLQLLLNPTKPFPYQFSTTIAPASPGSSYAAFYKRYVRMARSNNSLVLTLMGTAKHITLSTSLLENFFKKMSSLNSVDCSKGDILEELNEHPLKS